MDEFDIDEILSGTPDQPKAGTIESPIADDDDNRAIVLKSLQDYGASPVATAAIMGDIEQESSFEPRASGDRGTSRGLLQTGVPMFQQYERAALEHGIEPGSADYVYNQVPFVLDRFKRQHPDRWEAMQNAPDAATALKVFRGTKDWGFGITGSRFKYAANYERSLRKPFNIDDVLKGIPGDEEPTRELTEIETMTPEQRWARGYSRTEQAREEMAPLAAKLTEAKKAEARDIELLQKSPWMAQETAGQRVAGELEGLLKEVHPAFTLERAQTSLLPIERPFPETQETLPMQVVAGIWNFPTDVWNFATSPVGLSIGGIAKLGPLMQRAIALGFTADQIIHGAQAETLQDQVEFALGAATAGAGGLHGKRYVAPKTETRAGLETIEPDLAGGPGEPGVTARFRPTQREGEAHAETIRSDEGQVRGGGETGEPEVQAGAGESRGDIQRETSEPPSGTPPRPEEKIIEFDIDAVIEGKETEFPALVKAREKVDRLLAQYAEALAFPEFVISPSDLSIEQALFVEKLLRKSLTTKVPVKPNDLAAAGIPFLPVKPGASPVMVQPPTQEQKSIAAELDATVPAEGGPSAASENAARAAMPNTNTEPNVGDVIKVSPDQTALRPELMQYKQSLDPVTGRTQEHAETIVGEWDPVKAGNLLLWEPINPQQYGLTGNERYIVANGHGRFHEIKKQNVSEFNAQILRESAGYSARDASTLAAEANIADGKGTIFDTANFIRGQMAALGPDEAMGRAKTIGARGRKGATIALNAGDDLYASFINERISPDAAAQIADAAPRNDGLQRLGIQRALAGDDPAQVFNFLQAIKAKTGERDPTASQSDLFGSDDTAMQSAIAAGKRATEIQREIGEQINSVAGASKRPEKARALGVDVADPASVNRKLVDLRILRERARNWPMDKQISDLVLNTKLTPEQVVEQLAVPKEVDAAISEAASPSLRPGEKGTGDLFQGEDQPFNLAGETGKDWAAIKAAQEAKVKAEQEAQARADAAQGDLFAASPEPPVLGYERPETRTRAPADDPEFTALPVDLPEAVRFSNELLGVAISVKKKLKALQGKAAGVFRYGKGLGKGKEKGEIHLRADIADLLSEAEKLKLMEEAQLYAEKMAANEREIPSIAKQRYEFLLDQAYEEAKTRPPLRALKVIWHEIGHAIDYMRHAAEIEGVTQREMKGRGNIFGHIAALHDYLKGVIPLDPTKPAGKPLSPSEKIKMEKEAEKQLRKEFGPIGEIVETIQFEEPILRIVGITPADVKALFGLDAREATPELYKWFAEQSAETKKEIVRKAMRDVLDERLSALGKTEQIGTRTVERTVRKRVGREPTPQEVQARFRELFRAELERRNLAELKTVKTELEGAIAWWHGTDKMPSYFSTPEEMYAEAFSIFMNNPAALAKRAPTYSRLIWNYMEHRPEVAAVYDKIQNEIKAGVVEDRTEAAVLEGWDKADRDSVQEARRRQYSGRDFYDNVQYNYDRRMGVIYQAAEGAVNEAELKAAIGNYLYRATEHENILNRINREVAEPLAKHNLDWKWFGLKLFYDRIVHERYKIFNPGGHAPDRALKRLAKMETNLGPGRYNQLGQAKGALRKIYEDRVVAAMKRERMWSPELQKQIDDNVHYATFDRVREEDSITRLMNRTYGNAMSPHIYRQIGTVKDIKNPATAWVLKMLSLTSATARNTLKREAIRALREKDAITGAQEAVEANKQMVGNHWEYVPVENENTGTVVYVRDGKPQAFYVRRVVADALNGGNPIESKLLNLAIEGSGWMKGIYTQLNYAFWPFNFLKDTGAWFIQLPRATPIDWVREFPKAVAGARATVKGRPNPSADRALDMRVVISRGDPRGVWSAVENEYELRLAGYGLNPVTWSKEGSKVGMLMKAWNSYREFGQMVERTNKIAALNYLERKFPNMPDWKKAEVVRERGGSPNFLERPASPYIDFVALFYNPWKEAVRSVSKSARENPWSFSAKTTAFVVAPTAMQVVAASGGFGDGLEEMYKSVPDHDLSNFLVVPIGWADYEQKKVAYFRLPLWEPARILHGLLWGVATGRNQGLISFYGGTLPGLNPLLKTGAMWLQYELGGKNPYDSFLGKNVLTDTQFAAKGWPARKELIKYSWNQLGGGIVNRFTTEQLDNPATTKLEKFLQMPLVSNAIGRWIKVSNKGLSDADRRLTAPVEKQRAETRLAVQEITRKVLNNEGLNKNEKLLMRDPYAMQYYQDIYYENAKNREDPVKRRLKGKSRQEQMIIREQMMREQMKR